MKIIIVLAVVLAVGYTISEYTTVYQNKAALGERVTQYLDSVDERSLDQVKTNLVQDAAKLDVVLDPAQIHIVYEDTDRATGPQRFLTKLAEFENKKIDIKISYIDTVLGIKLRQEIARTKIKQIRVRQKTPPQYEELLK